MDQITMTDINPDYALSSADSVYFHPFLFCHVAIPIDSLVEYYIDLDKDNVNDFKIRMQHGLQFVSASNPCANYKYHIHIFGEGNNQVAIADNDHNISLFNFNEKIGGHLNWYNNATVTSAPFSFNFSGNKYLGLKIISGSNAYYGWLLVEKTPYTLKIKEMSINLASGNSIKAGQTQ